MEQQSKTIAESRVTLSMLMGQQETNIRGNVHGGVIMKMVDEAAGICAMRHARAPVVTVAIDSMTFVEPVLVGNLVMFNAELTYVGRTSMEVRVTVVAENLLVGTSRVTNTAYLVYVALDANSRPTAVPPVQYVSAEEKLMGEQAKARQDYRKQQREKEKTRS
jgi:acyl-CoA hydrolase